MNETAFRFLCRRLLLLLLVVCMIAAVGRRYEPGYGFTRMINMGDGLYSRALPAARMSSLMVRGKESYDGAQYVQLAFDPLLRNREGLERALDVPSYRAKRILLPWLSAVLGWGRPAAMVQVYALLNVVFWAGLLVLMVRLCPEADLRSLAVIAGVVLSTGALESVRRALTDLPAATLALAAIYFSGRSRPGWGAGLMTAAGLARETVLLSLGGLWNREHGKSRNLVVLAVPAMICTGWFGYVALRFPSVGDASHNLGWPLVTMNDRMGMIFRAGDWTNPRQLFCVLAMVSLTVQAVYLLVHPCWESPFWRMGILFVPLYFCLAMPVWEEYYAVTRAVLPLTVAFHLQLRAERGWRFWAWWLPANLYLWQGVQKLFLTSS